MEMTRMSDQPRFAALDVSPDKTEIYVMSLGGVICEPRCERTTYSYILIFIIWDWWSRGGSNP